MKRDSMVDELIPPSIDPSLDSLADAQGVSLRQRPLRLGRYRLIARVGSGGGATVYLALASGAAGVNKLLVVKVLKEELAEDPSFVAMFLDEARLSTRLNHPNIVQMIDVGRESGFYFTVMEYLDGKPLGRLLGVPGITRDVLLYLIAESLGGLHYAHELTDYDGTPLRVVHRDFSPPNIFVTYDGQAKLLDFGVAKMLMSSVTTEMDVLKGKPRYMAPEHMSGAGVDARADIFSAGIVLWEAISGQRMWAGKNDMAVLYAVGSGQIPRLEDAAPGTPPELVRIVHRALAPARDERYPTALALQEDLEAYLRRSSDVLRPRDIGRVLRTHFAGDRAQISGAVEAQLRALASESNGFRLVSIPDIETGTLGGAGEGSDPRISPLSNAPTVIPSFLRPPPKTNRYGVVGGIALVAAAIGTVVRMTPGAGTAESALESRLATEPSSPAREVSAVPSSATPEGLASAKDAGLASLTAKADRPELPHETPEKPAPRPVVPVASSRPVSDPTPSASVAPPAALAPVASPRPVSTATPSPHHVVDQANPYAE